MTSNISNKTLIVIARKYNDIFYAIATEEWSICNNKILLIIPNRAEKDSFACVDLFNRVIILPPDKGVTTRNLLNYIRLLKKELIGTYGDFIMMSNPEMLFNRLIVKYTNSKSVIFLEDGLMNYYSYHAHSNFVKRSLSSLMKIDDDSYIPKILKTYLHNPSLAEYYFGDKVKLDLSEKITIPALNSIPNLNKKKIFIAQDVLNVDEKYNEKQELLFNTIIKYFNIDYYVPRTYDYKERIKGCEILNIGKSGYTLEILASKYDFEIYGFTTSLLFTTKIINPNVITHRIISDKTKQLKIPQILNDNVDYIEHLD